MNAAERELLAVGRIEKAFGLKGEIIVDPLTDSPSRFRTLRRILVGRSIGDASAHSLERVWVESRGIRAKLTGVNSRTQAETLVGCFLYVDAANRLQPPRGRHFVHELIGLRVTDQDGRTVGTLKEVLRLPAQDVYVVERNGRDVMLPAVKEFVTAIDVKEGIMRVNLIDGMLEEQ